jgi:hypothetical protein
MALPKKKIQEDNVVAEPAQKNQHSLHKSARLSITAKDESHNLPLNDKDFEMVDEIEARGLKINLQQNLKNGEKITRIKLVTSAGKEIILNAEEAKQFIDRASDEIDKIVIEQVRQEGADRYSLHLANGNNQSSFEKQKFELKQKNIINIKEKIDNTNIEQLEKKINQSFFEKNLIQKDEAQNNTARKNASSHSEVTNSDAFPLTQEVRKNVTQNEDYVYSQRIFIRKRQKKGSDYFYRAENHIDLFNIGQSYMADFNNGKKSFAFSGEEAKEAKEKTIFGLCSFFNYHTDATVTIVTKTMDQTFYHSYVAGMHSVRKKIENENITISIYECDEFQVIEFDELVRVAGLLRSMHIEDFIQEIVNESDLIFWDLPNFEDMAKDRVVYFPTLRSVNHVTLMIKEGFTNFEFINRARDYFKKYGIALKGALINKEHKK